MSPLSPQGLGPLPCRPFRLLLASPWQWIPLRGLPTAISEIEGCSLKDPTSPFSLGDLGRQKVTPQCQPASWRPRPDRHTPAHQPLQTTPAAQPLRAFQRGAPYWTSHSYPVSGLAPPVHSLGSLDWRDPSPMADPALGSEGSESTVATQLAHSVDAQKVEPLRVGVVVQSLNQSSVLVLGSVLTRRAEMIRPSGGSKRYPGSDFVRFPRHSSSA